MKFVCMTCDAQMKSVESRRQPAEGTLSVVMECPECFGQVGMLTNPMETRLLDALDVSVCPVGGRNRAAEAREPAGTATSGGPAWSAEAEARLANVPGFVRDMARRGIEEFARGRGTDVITPELMDEARAAMGA